MRENAFALGWSPAEFYPATARDLNAAVRGFNRRHGGGKSTKPGANAPSRPDLDAMIARDKERQAQKTADLAAVEPQGDSD